MYSKSLVEEEVLEKFNHEIKADENYAQVVIEIKAPPNTYEEVKRIFNALGIHIIETKHLSSKRVLVKLDVRDMRSVALELTENGFSVKGINASSFGF